ncbi:MAG TPA: glycosyltransferase family 2 protein [Actinomycetota bacterium]|nr:glycosyltransferase family 2 protein [Actinomycetota bacterium]
MTEPSAAVPDLAVVVVNYNAGGHLLACLTSVLATAGDATLEVVVVDNASRDGSARRAAERFPEVRVIETGTNRGFAAGVNVGIRATTAGFVFVLNPDAEVTVGTLGALMKLARERPKAGLLGPVIRNADGSLYPSGRTFPSVVQATGHAFLGTFDPDNRWTREYTMSGWDRTTERVVDWVSGSAMLIRRAALDRAGLLDEGFFLYGEELDLCTRLRDAGWQVVFTPEVEVTHVGGVSTGRSRRMNLIHSRSIYRYYRKHRARGWKRMFLPLAWVVLRARAELVSFTRRSR